MPDIPSAQEISRLTGLLMPGIIILWIRARFRDVSIPTISEKISSYIIVSVVYNALAVPIFNMKGYLELSSWFWNFQLHFGFPLIVGYFIVLIDNSEKFYDVCAKLKLRPVHHTVTAWDRTFRNCDPAYVIVHLTDGSEIAGAWIEKSFASSASTDRDILIAQMWKIEPEGWVAVEPKRSILICGGSIRMIEFIEGGST
jgi:hypothetical protein